MLDELKEFCLNKGWLVDDFINDDFVWSEGFVIIKGDKRISIELHDFTNKIHVITSSQEHIYECQINTVKRALIWLMR